MGRGGDSGTIPHLDIEQNSPREFAGKSQDFGVSLEQLSEINEVLELGARRNTRFWRLTRQNLHARPHAANAFSQAWRSPLGASGGACADCDQPTAPSHITAGNSPTHSHTGPARLCPRLHCTAQCHHAPSPAPPPCRRVV